MGALITSAAFAAENDGDARSPKNVLVLPFPSGENVSRQTLSYRCAASGDGTSVTAQKLMGRFAGVAVRAPSGGPGLLIDVAYYNVGPTSLAVLPLEGGPLVFANVVSADGARYAADRYIWWSKGDGATLFESEADDAPRLACQEINVPGRLRAGF